MLINIDYRSSTVDITFITHHSRTIQSSVSRIYVICLFLKRFVTSSQWLERNFSACKKIKKAKNKNPLNSKGVWKHHTWYSVYLWPTIPKQNILYFYFTLEIYFNFRCCRHRHLFIVSCFPIKLIPMLLTKIYFFLKIPLFDLVWPYICRLILYTICTLLNADSQNFWIWFTR